MTFRSREHAAEQLAKALEKYKGEDPLVLAIPRGAVPMARTIAKALGGELDVVLVAKLGAPGQPECAIGAVEERGGVHLDDTAKRVGREYIDREIKTQREVLSVRRRSYTPVRPPIPRAGRPVIVVDDGLATGSTMIGALQAVRADKPATLVAAFAVAPPGTVSKIKKIADDVVCLVEAKDFVAVGNYFDDFKQVSDSQVVKALKSSVRDRNQASKGA